MSFPTQLLGGFQEIGSAFIQDLGVWWFLAPIVILWIAMEVYLGEYKKERWGFSSSLANSVSFTWINIASLRFISFQEGVIGDERLLIAILFLLYGVFLIYISFRHRFSERLLAAIAGPTPVYFLSVVSVLWGQGILAISLPVVVDLVILYGIIWTIWKVVKAKYLGVLGEVEAIKKGERPV